MSNTLIYINIPIFIKEIIDTIKCAGFEIYLVGGCIRDYIMGTKTTDWDLISNANPHILLDLFTSKKHINIIHTGIEFGTITLKSTIHNIAAEITTYRIEASYTNHRKPSNVQFISDVKIDLQRRDFSINAIICTTTHFTWSIDSNTNILYHKIFTSYPIYTKKLTYLQSILNNNAFMHTINTKDSKQSYISIPMILSDHHNALKDIKSRILTSIGPAYKRFNEDCLRILRAIRFIATLNYEFIMHSNTRIAAYMLAKNLRTLSSYRIHSEFCKILLGNRAGYALLAYRDIIIHIIPHLDTLQLKQYYHNCITISHTPEILELRMAIILDNNHIQASQMRAITIQLENLAFTRVQIQSIINILKLKNTAITCKPDIQWLMSHNTNEEVLYRLIANAANHINTTNKAQYIQYIEIFFEILHSNTCYKLSHLAINGNDIKLAMQKCNIKAYKQIGKILQYLLHKVIYENLPNNKESLHLTLESILKNPSNPLLLSKATQ